MQEYIKFHNHNIDKSLHDFICKELKSEKIKLDKIFWKKLSNIISELENIITRILVAIQYYFC